MSESTYQPLAGLWQPTQLQKLHYGSGSVQRHLLECLPTENSKAFIITGSSLATKTPLIRNVETLLGSKHAGTFSKIGQHAPIADLDAATTHIQQASNIDTIISIGGGSPIDSAKAISHRLHSQTGNWLFHITIPTTLSAGECTMIAGYTSATGIKTGLRAKELVPHVVLYDASFALHTPEPLLLSTGLRALDHALELLYYPTAAEMPTKWLCLQSAGTLFSQLQKFRNGDRGEDTVTALQLAAFASLGFWGTNVQGGLGLSHALGYALGSPYGIPHGMTSCLTLGHVVKLKAREPAAAEQIVRLLPVLGEVESGDVQRDAERVGDRVLQLVRDLGLHRDLGAWGVRKEQIPVIVGRATGCEEGEVYDAVTQLVEGLFG
ncbi:hypothetical protein IAQ61_002271 [Plenodomus lingam]|uniref:Similar to alcohol dehydrogenase n=1 Tax=Leptosphaeria maculans (strain JN3 / isolate v23.1.3 / race Av1-4-5-6-7-8) TaxID=985895 RepID=E4ZIC6_LEPMJ|nr:similar to alcohol dehydrogenase [Plenodomus lingam JN3]KAH9876910.1 hypothetical protein IAQ61_002271 [Plenodomus lingam]CBX90787.1 similar to alcohol dehydrogenase [Plenodomus lingam JN3]